MFTLLVRAKKVLITIANFKSFPKHLVSVCCLLSTFLFNDCISLKMQFSDSAVGVFNLDLRDISEKQQTEAVKLFKKCFSNSSL